jgi:hypothetical protein
MASKPLMESVDEQFSIQQAMRKNRKRVLSGQETALFNEAKKVRQTSSELIAQVEQLEADENKSQIVENVWKKRIDIFERLLCVMSNPSSCEVLRLILIHLGTEQPSC